MSAGLLRERVVFEQRSSESDGAGNFEDDWTPTSAIAARIQCLKGGERVIGQRLSGVQPVVITVRSTPFTRTISAAWRARNDRTGETYNLAAPRPDERGAYIDFLATAGGADG